MEQINQHSKERGIPVSALCLGLSLSRATFYRKKSPKKAFTPSVNTAPHNILPVDTKQTILDLLHSKRFVDRTPYQAYYSLLDEGKYYASIRSFYRILEENGETQERRNIRNHRDTVKPELMAEKPNEVWSWDISKLLSFHRLTYYYLYVILDIYSRYVVGWMIADRECSELAKKLIQESTLKQGIQPGQLNIHSDNGPPMRSYGVAQLLEHLGVQKTHNRPYTSNDNPFSESQFKTMKYCPEFPARFESIEQAERFCQRFFTWYNHEHYHSGILYLTPVSVHYGEAENVLEKRHQVLLNAYMENPNRFGNRVPQPKFLSPAYINPPEKMTDNCLHGENYMA